MQNQINVPSFIIEGTTRRFYTPESDQVFHSIFAKPGNETITTALLKSLLDEEIPEISLNANPEIFKSRVNDKKQTVDVKVICPNSKQNYIIEMQNKYNEFDSQRFSTYSEKMHIEGLKQGKSYDTLEKVTLIVLLAENNRQFKNIPNYHTVWNSRESVFSQYIFCKDVTIHLFELKKYIEQKKNAQRKGIKFKINPWIEFFINPLGKEVEEAMRTEKELRYAVDLLKMLNQDDEVRRIASDEEFMELDWLARENDRKRREQKALEDSKARGMKQGMKLGMKEGVRQGVKQGMKQGMQQGMRQGMQQGMQQGIQQEKKNVVAQMLNYGMDKEKIAEILKCSVEELNKLIDASVAV